MRTCFGASFLLVLGVHVGFGKVGNSAVTFRT